MRLVPALVLLAALVPAWSEDAAPAVDDPKAKLKAAETEWKTAEKRLGEIEAVATARKAESEAKTALSAAEKSEAVATAKKAEDDARKAVEAKLLDLLAADAEAGPTVTEIRGHRTTEDAAKAKAKAAKDAKDKAAEEAAKAEASAATAAREAAEKKLKPAAEKLRKQPHPDLAPLIEAVAKAETARKEAETAANLPALKKAHDEAKAAARKAWDEALAADAAATAARKAFDEAKAAAK